MRLTPGGAIRFEEIASLPFTLLAYEFNNACIRKKEKAAFLEFFDVDRIAHAGLLHRLFGNVLFSIGGFDHDERALHEIAEVRDYLQELAVAWPYFFYAASLEEDFLRELIWCMLPNLASVTDPKDEKRYIVEFSPKAANEAYQALLLPFQRLCGRDLTMNQARFNARVSAIQRLMRKNTA